MATSGSDCDVRVWESSSIETPTMKNLQGVSNLQKFRIETLKLNYLSEISKKKLKSFFGENLFQIKNLLQFNYLNKNLV